MNPRLYRLAQRAVTFVQKLLYSLYNRLYTCHMKSTQGTQLRHLIELLDGAVGAAYEAAGLDYRPRYTPEHPPTRATPNTLRLAQANPRRAEVYYDARRANRRRPDTERP